MRGIGSLARILGDQWLNTEDLDRLYLRCADIFDEHVQELLDEPQLLPVERYMQCRWLDEMSDSSRALIDRRIRALYASNEDRWNGTRYNGPAGADAAADVEISSMIVLERARAAHLLRGDAKR